MNSYQLGKDIQAIHEQLDKLTQKKCGCHSPQSDAARGPREVTISRIVLKQLIEQLHYLAAVASGQDIATGKETQYTWDGFLAAYNPEGRFDWCCRCDGSFGDRHCHDIRAITEADAISNCAFFTCDLSSSSSVTAGKCGPSDDCDFGP